MISPTFALLLTLLVQQVADPRDVCQEPVFTPLEVRPEIRDLSLAVSIVIRHYKESLAGEGKSGRVLVWLCIDEEGKLRNYKLATSSGDTEIDEVGIRAAVEIAEKVGFTPALNRGRPVTVWIHQPISFTVRDVRAVRP